MIQVLSILFDIKCGEGYEWKGGVGVEWDGLTTEFLFSVLYFIAGEEMMKKEKEWRGTGATTESFYGKIASLCNQRSASNRLIIGIGHLQNV